MIQQGEPSHLARFWMLMGSGALFVLALRFFSQMTPGNPGSLRVAFCLGSALTSGSLLLLLPAIWPGTAGEGGPVRTGLKWGGIVGGVGLLGGMLGPLVFYPEANLGPILGVLITGPLGWSIGIVAGVLKGFAEAQPRFQGREES